MLLLLACTPAPSMKPGAAPAPAPADPALPPSPFDPPLAVVARWIEAINDIDRPTLTTLYAPEVRYLGTSIAATERAERLALVGRLERYPADVAREASRSTAAPDRVRVTLRPIGADVVELILAEIDGSWRIVEEDAYAPRAARARRAPGPRPKVQKLCLDGSYVADARGTGLAWDTAETEVTGELSLGREISGNLLYRSGLTHTLSTWEVESGAWVDGLLRLETARGGVPDEPPVPERITLALLDGGALVVGADALEVGAWLPACTR